MSTPKTQKFLVAVDGSERSLNTARYLSQVAAFKPARIRFFSVLSGVPEYYWDLAREPSSIKPGTEILSWARKEREKMEMHQGQCREILVAAGFDPKRIETVLYDRKRGVARDIIAEARKGCDAVVIRRRGTTQIMNLVMGSVAEKLLAAVDFVPLLFAGLKPQNDRLLVAYDGSEAANRAVDTVGRWLGGSGSWVQLIHVLRSDTLFGRDTDFKELSEAFAVSAEPGVSAALKEAAGRLVAAGFEEDRVAWKVLRGSSSRAGTIVEVAEKEDFGTIVVGRRGLSRVREFSLGRVGNKVVHLGRSHTVWVVS